MATRNLVIAGKNQGAVDRVTFPYADTANESDLAVKGTATFYETSDASSDLAKKVAIGTRVYGQTGSVNGTMYEISNENAPSLEPSGSATGTSGYVNIYVKNNEPVYISPRSGDAGTQPIFAIHDEDFVSNNIVQGANIFGLSGDLVVPKIEKSGTTLSIS